MNRNVIPAEKTPASLFPLFPYLPHCLFSPRSCPQSAAKPRHCGYPSPTSLILTVRNQDTALTLPRYRKRLCGWMFLLMAGCGHALRAPEDQIFRGQSPGQNPAPHSVPGGHTGLQSVPRPVGQAASPVNVYLPVTLHEAVSSALSSSNAILVLNGGVNVASITLYDVEIARQRV